MTIISQLLTFQSCDIECSWNVSMLSWHMHDPKTKSSGAEEVKENDQSFYKDWLKKVSNV